MIKRKYYSSRTNKSLSDQEITFDVLKKIFLVIYNKFENEGYFQKYFGTNCTDGYILGELGQDIDAIIFINLRKDNLYPIRPNLPNYTEEDLFDVIEFLYDHCSKGLSKDYHSWNDCGFHYGDFDDYQGQQDFREQINQILREYKEGFEISDKGEILKLSDNGMSTLLEADVPTDDKINISNRIDNAILKFRRYRSTLEERKDAIRELADVLEFLRPDIKEHLNRKDENDLFKIANGFGIRHHNKDQQYEYDKAIWYSWIFYYYLATIHAVLRMINRNNT